MFGPEEEVEVNPVGFFLAAIFIVVAFVGGVNVGKTDTTPYITLHHPHERTGQGIH